MVDFIQTTMSELAKSTVSTISQSESDRMELVSEVATSSSGMSLATTQYQSTIDREMSVVTEAHVGDQQL